MELQSEVIKIFPRLVDSQKQALKKLGVISIDDLLHHFPTRYIDPSAASFIKDLRAGDKSIIFGKIKNLETGKAYRKKISMAKATIDDGTGTIEVVWFHQPYIAKMIRESESVKIEGTVGIRNGKLYFSNPKIENVSTLPISIGNSLFKKGEVGSTPLAPVYGESRGISSLWFYHAIQKVLKSGVLDSIVDPIPQNILKRYSLPTLRTALIWIHSPKEKDAANASRKRFAFEEIFFIQIKNALDRLESKKLKAPKIHEGKDKALEFRKRFPFSFTEAQEKTISTILKDFESGTPMARLLNGDVGSGKTAVAATTAFSVVMERPEKLLGHLQVAYMAPTEILATQHFYSFIEYFKGLEIPIALLTGTTCLKFPSKVNKNLPTQISKTQLLKWVSTAEIGILIGTHALIQKKVKFKNLAYVVIDEQHRFGTKQRKSLARKDGAVPHLLSMTATPIPRTLALTIYGNLDLSLLDQMPSGRKPIITEIVLPNAREIVYEKVREEILKGRQVYVICPRISEPDPEKEQALNVKSVKEEAKRLKTKVFKECEIGILHSKMSPKEKDSVMKDFSDKKINILVATSVVEVGVNVPNATVILIEGAERFGLSQLHQLRGRVIRSNDQAYCFVFAETKSDKTIERLKAFKNAKDGFELSELDLKLRGAGELGGEKQWGITDVGMEAISNLKLVEAARVEAKSLVENDSELKNFPDLRDAIAKSESIHLE